MTETVRSISGGNLGENYRGFCRGGPDDGRSLISPRVDVKLFERSGLGIRCVGSYIWSPVDLCWNWVP